jgi:hypothetical protein
MKDSGCWINGLFFFTPLHMEVQGIRAEVEHLQDYLLVDEVAYICDDHPEIDYIISQYFKVPELSELDRERLIWYYVLYNIEDYLMIMEDGEL